MDSIICPLTFVPIRKEPSHQSEQVTQLLFGETAQIMALDRDWLQIRTTFDACEGWIEKTTVLDNLNSSLKKVTKIPQWTQNESFGSVFISIGSEIPYPDKESKISIGNTNFLIDEISVLQDEFSFYNLVDSFLGTPHIWGGRSLYGIDSSALAQIIYKASNIVLPRFASQQVALGNTIPFITQINPGDLAFFDNEEGRINHVGIIVSKGRIMHSYGFVKIDRIDQQGIYNPELKKYTHQLRIIKRITDQWTNES